MVTFVELQGVMVEYGLSKVKLVTVGRQLRADGHLMVEGRGPHARHLNHEEASKVIIAYLGSSKAVNASIRLGKLAPLRERDGGLGLLDALKAELEQGATQVEELRVSRTGRWAAIVYLDGRRVQFQQRKLDASKPKFRAEGILNGAALGGIAQMLAK